VQRKILREKQGPPPSGWTMLDRGPGAIGRRTLGSPVRPSAMLIKPAISGLRMGHLGLYGGVAMTFY
jgi:hypothetical protein